MSDQTNKGNTQATFAGAGVQQSLSGRATEAFSRAVAGCAEAHFAAIEGARLGHGLRSVSFLGAPLFFEAQTRPHIGSVLEKVTSAIERVGSLYFSGSALPDNRSLHRYIPLSDRVRELCLLDAANEPRLCVSRYDVCADPRGGDWQILEINPGDPSALGWHDALLQGLLESPATATLRRQFAVDADQLLPPHRQALVEAWQQMSRRGDMPTLAFAVANESTVRDDHLVMAAAARAAGLPAHVADPREFDSDDRRLYLHGEPVDVVWRDIIDEFATDPYWGATAPFRRAYRAGGFALRNRFCVAFAECKGVFAILSDPAFAPLFTPDELAALRAHVPWTRLLADGPTTYMGRDVDLGTLVRERRDEFVIKPNIGCCGHDVLVGLDAAPGVWEARVARAIAAPGSDVVQRYCLLPTARFPAPDGLGRELAFVSSFWQSIGTGGCRLTGSFVRASPRRVINIHQGGGLSTIFWTAAP